MVDFAVLIPAHVAVAGRGRWYPSRSSVCLMTRDLREDIRQTISRQHDAPFGQGLDGRDIVGGEDLPLAFVSTPSELSVVVGLVFRQAEALLFGPFLKPSFPQFGDLRSGMVRRIFPPPFVRNSLYMQGLGDYSEDTGFLSSCTSLM